MRAEGYQIRVSGVIIWEKSRTGSSKVSNVGAAGVVRFRTIDCLNLLFLFSIEGLGGTNLSEER